VFHSLIAKTVSWASRRRAIVVAALVCTLAVAVFGARRLTFDPDVLSLLPRDGRAIPAFRDYVAQVGSMDALYVVLTAPEDYGIADYQEQVDRWLEALRDAPEIARVDAGLADPGRNLQWLSDRRLLLLDDDALERALARFEPTGIRDAVVESRALLSVPSAEVAEMVRHDPLGLFALVRESIGSGDASLGGLGATGGGYVSEDGRSRLLIARPVRPPFDAEFSRTLDARLQEVRGNLANHDASADDDLPPLDVAFAGGHRVAVETEAVVKRESIFNTFGSLALILPLLYIVYRSFWLVVVGAIPSGLALLFVLGALGFAGARLSSAATGAAAMLFGLGIDGVVLLYVAYLHRAPAGDPASHSSALAGPSTSMLLGMWTTAATFYGLTFVDFPSLQQLGRLIGHSMVLCGILTLLIIPALLPRRPPVTRAKGLTMPRLAAWTQRRRGTIVAGALVLTAVLGACARDLRIDPTLDRLRSVTGAARLEMEIAERFGLPRDVYIVLATGPSLEPLLQTNERLAAALERELPGVASQLPSALVPSEARQARTAARIATARLTPEAVRASLEQARAAEGFRAGTFEPFEAALPRLLDAGQRLTYDEFVGQGLGDLLEPLIVKRADGWTLVSYAFPEHEADVESLERVVAEVDASQTLTGLPLVNRELADRFVPQFVKGLVIGTVLVIVIVVAAFRDWRLSAFALLPTVIGLVWTAGLLALAGIELDLFAMFAVVTFLGIGVDYGIHLVHRYQERGNAEHATAELAPVIFVAGAITLLGYGTLINSSYPPLQSIGAVSAVSVIALAAASVIVLPALLQWGQRR
jgi:predicted RND superfamily exporter protein